MPGKVPYDRRSDETRGHLWLTDEEFDYDDLIEICHDIAREYAVDVLKLDPHGPWGLVEGSGWHDWRDGVEITISYPPRYRNEYDGTVFEFFLDRRVSPYDDEKYGVYLYWSVRKKIHTETSNIADIVRARICAKTEVTEWHLEKTGQKKGNVHPSVVDFYYRTPQNWAAKISVVDREEVFQYVIRHNEVAGTIITEDENRSCGLDEKKSEVKE